MTIENLLEKKKMEKKKNTLVDIIKAEDGTTHCNMWLPISLNEGCRLAMKALYLIFGFDDFYYYFVTTYGDPNKKCKMFFILYYIKNVFI